MLAPGMDYSYSLYNFVGVNVSMIGGLYYARIQLLNKLSSGQKAKVEPQSPSTPALSSPEKT